MLTGQFLRLAVVYSKKKQAIEIDDGLKPVCFYKTENGLVIAPTFDKAKARADKKEDDP